MKTLFPNWWQAILICLIISLMALISSATQLLVNNKYDTNPEITGLLSYVFSFGMIALTLKLLNKKINVKVINISQGWNVKNIVLTIFISLILITGIVPPLSSLIPMPEGIKNAIYQIIQQTSFYSFFLMVICAPIIEEYIFRGVILRGLLTNSTPLKAILLSSFLFGICHLNPWQFVTGFVMGLFLGWLYYRTKELKINILSHMTVNGFGFFSRFYWKSRPDLIYLDYIELLGGIWRFVFITSCAVIFLVLGIFLLHQRLDSK